MASEKNNGPVHFSIVATEETTPTAMYGMYEILSSVGVAWPLLTKGSRGTPLFEVSIVSADGKPFSTAGGIPVAPHHAVHDVEFSDVVVVTDIDLPLEIDPCTAWPELAGWLRQQHARGATLCSVCTGGVVLARAGLLDGLDATTHWSATGIISECFPNVVLRPERIIQPAGPEHRIITAGGASAWQDLLLYLIARFASEDEARNAAKIFLLGDRSEGQLPFAAMAAPRNHQDGAIAGCQTWVADHYDDANPVAAMTELSGLNERTFKRRFRKATGYSPIDYVQALRIEEAKHLLETTDLPTDLVGREVGYEEPAFFRRLFRRRTGTTPARYRQRFRTVMRAQQA
ncbi:MAG: helix-turn-helix domain-containing protein [Anderseniella sp.]|jgi:transcriptional regulator GlxA family with amidase domain|nr:helix-turn-helix domain-containing protein [Anderseniella sp.]